MCACKLLCLKSKMQLILLESFFATVMFSSTVGIADEKTRHIASLVARQKSKKPKSRRTTVAIQRHVPKPTVPYYMRTYVKQLLSAHPGGVLSTMFCSTYERRFGQKLDYARHGFMSLGEFLRALSDIVEIEHMKGGGFRVFTTSTASGKQWNIANKGTFCIKQTWDGIR